MLNPHNDVLSRRDFDSVDDDVDVVDLNDNEPNIEGLDDTSYIDHVKRVVDGRDPPTDCDHLNGTSIRPISPHSLSLIHIIS